MLWRSHGWYVRALGHVVCVVGLLLCGRETTADESLPIETQSALKPAEQLAPRAGQGADVAKEAAVEEPFVLWITDTGASPIATDWWVTSQDVEQAQFQPSIRPESFAGLRVRRPGTRPLSPSPVITVSAFQPLLPSSGIDRLLIATNATSGQKRQPTASENVLVGRRKGQTPGGSHWIPAREDLDTMLSKIDSHVVESVTVTKGPYNVMEGPGLAFYGVELLRAPRFENGYESHSQTVLEYQTNGEQWYGRQAYVGGSDLWGYRIGYTHRTGSDFQSGDGTEFVSSYNSRLPNFALGADLTENSTIDFHYLRVDQTDVEFPGQVFDIDFLVTDAYEIKYALGNQRWFDRFDFETWYNRTRFEGNANSQRKRQQIPVLDSLLISGLTDADSMTTGFSASVSWGDIEEYFTAGTDFRYAKQRLNEIDKTSPFTTTNFPIPRSHSSVPGLFWEGQVAPRDGVLLRAGARVDWVSTNADGMVPGTAIDDLQNDVLFAEFDQHFNLWAAFLTIERQLGRGWTVTGGAGHSMRPPTMTELYAIAPFLAVLPQFLFNSPFGNPNLDPERLWQIDLGFNYESENVRGGVNGFHGWVQDYITFDASPSDVILGPNFTPLNYTWVNTQLATLAGVEAYGELDSTDSLSSFASFSYIEGRDHTRLPSNSPIRAEDLPGTNRSQASFGTPTEEEPLPVMRPLESRLGIRLQDPQDSRWRVEVVVRIVDNQDRIATSLFEQLTPGFTTVDIHGYWQATENLLVTAGVENVGDRNYQEHFDPHRQLGALVLQPGMNFFFGSELNY